MSIDVPTWVFVCQWVLTFALAALVIAMYRQLAHLMDIGRRGSDRDGLPVGAIAPPFEFEDLDGLSGGTGRFDPEYGRLLLLFADPGCGSCRDAVMALQSYVAHARGLGGLHTLIATDASQAEVRAIEEFHKATSPVVRIEREVRAQLYRTFTTPFAYLIDESGVVRAKGTVTSAASLERLIANGGIHDTERVRQ